MEAFLKLIDRVIELLDARTRRRKELFTEIVEPLFTELQPVVDDYFALFMDVRRMVEHSKPAELQEKIASIRDQREAMLHHRVKVRELAEAIRASVHDRRVAEFADRIMDFFFSSRFHYQIGFSSGARLVDLCEYVASQRISRGIMLELLATTLQNLHDRWVAIAQSYASLRLHCLRSE